MTEEHAEEHEERDWGEDLYKKWFRSSSQGGFLSIRPWWDAGKVSVDIGEIDGNGGLKSHTNVWCGVVNLGLYLRAVYNGTAEELYPMNERAGAPTPEGFVYYGGAVHDGQPRSRILKVHHWVTGEGQYDPRSFVWKTGIFEGRQSKTGAFIPDMSKPISTNMIKVSRLEMAEIDYRVDLAIRAYAAQNPDWMNKFNGKKRI